MIIDNLTVTALVIVVPILAFLLISSGCCDWRNKK